MDERVPAASSGIEIFCKKRYYSLLGIYPECVVRDADSERSVRLAWGDVTRIELEPDRLFSIEVHIRVSTAAVEAEGYASAECSLREGEWRSYVYRAPYVTGGTGTLLPAPGGT